MTVDPHNIAFQRAFDLVANTTRNVFLTGRAGTGKTTFLKYLKENCSKAMAVVAPTGVAAINAGGVTINSLFQIKPGFNEPKAPPTYDLSLQKRAVLMALDLLIIDEVSMVRCDLLEMVEKTCRYYGNRQQPFGGKQVLFIGDPYQLPPVVGNDDKDVFYRFYASPFFFKTDIFWQAKPIPIELQKIYRQNDRAFIDLLNRVRVNAVNNTDLEMLRQKVVGPEYPFAKEKYLCLGTKNAQVGRINEQELAALPGKEFIFHGHVTGKFDLDQMPTDLNLSLKEGAQVMFVKNDTGSERRYYNGKLGVIQRIQDEMITVSFPEGGSTSMEKVTWERIKYEWDEQEKKVVEKVEGTFTQYPLKLAWAITVHKSQGLSLDRVFADVGDAWDSGQVYVALSRCTTFEGLKLARPIGRGAIRVDPEVEKFYEWVVRETEKQEKPPVISFFESDKSLLTEPSVIQLKWSVNGAVKVTISGLGEQAPTGSAMLRPKRATQYELIAYNEFGVTSRQSIQIKVSDKPPVIHDFATDRTFLTDNTPAVLSWHVEGAENLYIEPDIGKVTGRISTEVFTRTDQAFTLRAESYFGAVSTRQIEIQVSKEPPVIEFFQASQEYILADMPVELSWKVANAEKVEISPVIGQKEGGAGFATVKLKESVILKLTAYSWFGITASSQVQIFVIPVPIIESLLAPTMTLDVQLNIAIDRPSLPDFASTGNSHEFPWVRLGGEQFIKSEVHIPTRISIWRMPEFDSVFDRIRAEVTHKLQELIDLLKRK